MGAISHTDTQPLYVWFRNAPGRRHYGRARSERGQENLERSERVMASPEQRVVIIGAGHNGLVAACYLANAGFAPLVLERRGMVGGTAVTEELHPGFRCPAVLHTMGPLLPHIVSDLQLARQGLEITRPDIRVLALHPGGPAIRIYENPERTASELASVSPRDGARYPEFHASFAKIG